MARVEMLVAITACALMAALMLATPAASQAPPAWVQTLEKCNQTNAEMVAWGEPLENRACTDPIAELKQGKRPEYNGPWRNPCRLEWWYGERTCKALDGVRIVFLGDSLTRHVFDAELVLAKDDTYAGYMPEDATEYAKWECSCGKLFTSSKKVCREQGASFRGSPEFRRGDEDVTHPNGTIERSAQFWYTSKACGGRLTVDVIHVYQNWKTRITQLNALNHLRRILTDNAQNTYVLLGGHPLHRQAKPGSTNGESLDASYFCDHMVTPVANMLEVFNLPKSRVLVMGMHRTEESKFDTRWEKWGVKLPRLPLVEEYNKQMERCTAEAGLRVMDTYALTDNMPTGDGFHYEMPLNLIKAQLVNQYISNERSKERR